MRRGAIIGIYLTRLCAQTIDFWDQDIIHGYVDYLVRSYAIRPSSQAGERDELAFLGKKLCLLSEEWMLVVNSNDAVATSVWTCEMTER